MMRTNGRIGLIGVLAREPVMEESHNSSDVVNHRMAAMACLSEEKCVTCRYVCGIVFSPKNRFFFFSGRKSVKCMGFCLLQHDYLLKYSPGKN